MLATATDGCTRSNQNKTPASSHCKDKNVDENPIKTSALKNTNRAGSISQGEYDLLYESSQNSERRATKKTKKQKINSQIPSLVL